MARAGLLLVLVIPLLVTPSTLFPFVVGKALLARVVIEVTFVLWLALIIYYPRHRPGRSWILGALGLWVLASLLAGLAGVSPTRSMWSTYERMQGVIDLLHWFAYIVMAASVFRTLGDWRMLFSVNLGVCGLVSALGIGQHFGWFDSALLSSSERLDSTVGNPTYMGAYAMTSVLAGLGLLWHSFGDRGGEAARASRAQRRRRFRQSSREFRIDYLLGLRAFWVLAMTLSLWAMWLTATRGALVGMIAGVAAFALGYILWGGMRWVRLACWGLLATAAAAVALLAIFGLNSGSDPVTETEETRHRTSVFETGWLDDRSVRGRMESMRTGVDAWLERPLLGWGPENFLIAWGRHAAPAPDIVERFDQAHNKPVETLATTGIIGLAGYLAVWAALGCVMLRSVRRRAGYEQLLAAALAATLASYFVQNLFLFDTPVTVMLFAGLAAFAVSEEWRTADGGGSPSRIAGVLAGWGRRWRLPSASGILRAPAGVALVAIALAALAAAGAVFYNGRQYSAAATTLQGRAAPSWEQRSAYYDRAIAQFPGMANYPRLYLINDAAVVAESEYSRGFSDDEFGQIVAPVQAAGEQGLAAEPENWRFRVALARFYLAAAGRDAEYIGPAQRNVAEAARLAPAIPEVGQVNDRAEQLARELAARFHVERTHQRLIYTKTPCCPADTQAPFFLHIYPTDPDDLRLPTAPSGGNGTASQPLSNGYDFVFAEYGDLRNGRCTAARELPEYGISRIHTGQYLADGDGSRTWQKEIFLDP